MYHQCSFLWNYWSVKYESHLLHPFFSSYIPGNWGESTGAAMKQFPRMLQKGIRALHHQITFRVASWAQKLMLGEKRWAHGNAELVFILVILYLLWTQPDTTTLLDHPSTHQSIPPLSVPLIIRAVEEATANPSCLWARSGVIVSQAANCIGIGVIKH